MSLFKTFTSLPVIKLSLGLWFVVSIIISAIALLALQQIKSDQVNELIELKEELHSLFKEEGLAAILDEYELQEHPVWHKQDSDVRFDEEDLLFALYRNNKLLLGSTELAQTLTEIPKWTVYNSDIDTPPHALFLHFKLNETYAISLLQRRDGYYQTAKELLTQVILWFVILSLLPIAVINAAITFRRERRILGIKHALIQVAKSPDSERLTIEKAESDGLNELIISINEMLDNIADLHSTMKTMSVGIAHDLKTPLTRVANRLHSMQQDITSPDTLLTHLDKASTDLHSVITTFNNLVRLNAIESGKHKQGFKKIDISVLSLDLAQSYEPVFTDSGRTFEISVVEGVTCLADEDLINQLICNLLENALDYSAPNAHVWLRLQSHTNGALLQVGDNGPGISPMDQAHVFDKFYRADVSRAQPGNGLGLSIVLAICKVHDADIQQLNNQKGAVFNIELPLLSQ
ncbi:hypothetical protein PCIT_a0213 [Pseudoalteromonas citrea]|uniref:histidine kinase n=2 Tax=Pseudoalteromonas citrea TaxID=43655 RepID=A0AAD4AKA2_9GAMM|nr:HAMP domain-containing sensor histidine kinase [Pseudoalteromonas citrea]KAF7773877.1 hypothetical protein PCIT_a0213 [Pseudoalteromonas citrea]